MGMGAKAAIALALILALLGSYWGVYEAGNKYGQNAVNVAVQAETIQRLSVRVSENSALADTYRVNAELESTNHEKELADVRATAAHNAGKRVPVDATKFCGIAGTTQATKAGSPEQTNPRTGYLPESFTGDLRQLATDADSIIADYRTLRARVESSNCFKD
jgi:hypothetical protein